VRRSTNTFSLNLLRLASRLFPRLLFTFLLLPRENPHLSCSSSDLIESPPTALYPWLSLIPSAARDFFSLHPIRIFPPSALSFIIC